jgi:hypothetical protein
MTCDIASAVGDIWHLILDSESDKGNIDKLQRTFAACHWECATSQRKWTREYVLPEVSGMIIEAGCLIYDKWQLMVEVVEVRWQMLLDN